MKSLPVMLKGPAHIVVAKPGGYEVAQQNELHPLLSESYSLCLAEEEILTGHIWVLCKLEKTGEDLDPGILQLRLILHIRRVSKLVPVRNIFAEQFTAKTSRELQSWMFSQLPDICEELGLINKNECGRAFDLLEELDNKSIWLDDNLEKFKLHRESLLLVQAQKRLAPPTQTASTPGGYQK